MELKIIFVILVAEKCENIWIFSVIHFEVAGGDRVRLNSPYPKTCKFSLKELNLTPKSRNFLSLRASISNPNDHASSNSHVSFNIGDAKIIINDNKNIFSGSVYGAYFFIFLTFFCSICYRIYFIAFYRYHLEVEWIHKKSNGIS